MIAVVGCIFFAVLYFTIDLGFNSKRFVSNDFNTAFNARKTGNCELFRSFIAHEYNDSWTHECYMEKQDAKRAIKSFKILTIQVDGKDAFLQVELQRNPFGTKELKPYSVSYQMIRSEGGLFGKWLINQVKK